MADDWSSFSLDTLPPPPPRDTSPVRLVPAADTSPAGEPHDATPEGEDEDTTSADKLATTPAEGSAGSAAGSSARTTPAGADPAERPMAAVPDADPVAEPAQSAPAAASGPSTSPRRPSRSRATAVPRTADDHSAPETPEIPAAPAGAARPARGHRVSARQLADQRDLRGYADRVRAVLAGRPQTAGATVVGAEAASESEVAITIRAPQAVEAVQDALLDVCTAFGVEDLDAVIDGATVTLWVPKVAEGPATQKAAWVPAEVRERSRRHNERTGESVTQQVLSAFNAYSADLSGWFTPPAQVTGPMGVSDRPRRRELEGTQVQIYMYLKPSQLALLDATSRSVGAASRSDLVTELLDRYLD